jgi:hypothetical protein
VSEIKHVIDALGRGQKDGDVKGIHLGQILTYLQGKKGIKKCGALLHLRECRG